MSRMMYCPHCHQSTVPIPSLPGDVMAVLICQTCHEWSVLFRDQAIPLKRTILEAGSNEERQQHLAEVISHFLANGLFSELMAQAHPQTATSTEPDEEALLPAPGPITEEETRRFAAQEISLLDDPDAFKHIFG